MKLRRQYGEQTSSIAAYVWHEYMPIAVHVCRWAFIYKIIPMHLVMFVVPTVTRCLVPLFEGLSARRANGHLVANFPNVVNSRLVFPKAIQLSCAFLR